MLIPVTSRVDGEFEDRSDGDGKQAESDGHMHQ